MTGQPERCKLCGNILVWGESYLRHMDIHPYYFYKFINDRYPTLIDDMVKEFFE